MVFLQRVPQPWCGSEKLETSPSVHKVVCAAATFMIDTRTVNGPTLTQKHCCRAEPHRHRCGHDVSHAVFFCTANI